MDAFDFLDTRSFRSLWYWIMVAAFWSFSGARILGVPAHWLNDAAARAELMRIASMHAAQMGVLRSYQVTLIAAAITILIGAGFFYQIELAQAVGFIAIPGVVLIAMNRDLVARLNMASGDGDVALLLRRHQRRHIILSWLSLLATALWGMSHILHAGF